MRFLPLTGISPDMAHLKRAGVLLGGVFPYLAGIVVYNSIYDFPRLMRYCIFMTGVLGMALMGGWMSGDLSRRLFRGVYPRLDIRWRHAWTAVGAGTGIIALELLTPGLIS